MLIKRNPTTTSSVSKPVRNFAIPNKKNIKAVDYFLRAHQYLLNEWIFNLSTGVEQSTSNIEVKILQDETVGNLQLVSVKIDGVLMMEVVKAPNGSATQRQTRCKIAGTWTDYQSVSNNMMFTLLSGYSLNYNDGVPIFQNNTITDQYIPTNTTYVRYGDGTEREFNDSGVALSFSEILSNPNSITGTVSSVSEIFKDIFASLNIYIYLGTTPNANQNYQEIVYIYNDVDGNRLFDGDGNPLLSQRMVTQLPNPIPSTDYEGVDYVLNQNLVYPNFDQDTGYPIDGSTINRINTLSSSVFQPSLTGNLAIAVFDPNGGDLEIGGVPINTPTPDFTAQAVSLPGQIKNTATARITR